MRSFLIVLGLTVLVPAAYGQNRPKVFDNFERSQGVAVYVPVSLPAFETARPAKTGKRSKGARPEAAGYEKRVRKTSQTGVTVQVSEGLATRTAASSANAMSVRMGTAAGLKGFTTGNATYDAYIVESSRRYGLDPLLIYSQMHQESAFKIRATSHKGASGLMQLMPATARRFGVTKIYDPQQNIDAGVKYMRWLLDTFRGNMTLALAGYNAGEGAVMKYGWQVPPYRETQEYVRRITGRYNSITDPRSVISAPRVNNSMLAKLERNDPRPLTAYEPNALAVRLPGGKMMLVNQ